MIAAEVPGDSEARGVRLCCAVACWQRVEYLS